MKVYLKKINDKYMVETDYYSGVIMEINGKRFSDFKSGWIPQKPKTIKIIEKKTRVISYGNLKPEDYEREIEKLGVIKDEEGYPIFENLEQEYAYKKFCVNHEKVYEEYEEKITPEIMEWEITGRIDNEFITPFRFLGKKDVKDNETLYEYKPDPYKMAQTIANKLNLEEVSENVWGDNTQGMKWSIPDHSKKDLQFTKIAGEYADYHSLPKFRGISYGTWEECEKVYNRDYKAIKNMFEWGVAKFKAKGKNFDKAKMIKELESLKSMVNRINPKVKSELKPYFVVNEINKLIRDFKWLTPT